MLWQRLFTSLNSSVSWINMERRLKHHKRYLFYRIYTPVVWVSFCIFVIFWWISVATNKEPSASQMIAFGILFPCFGAAVFMIMNLFVFPPEFGIFGTLERDHFPSEQPILKITGSWGIVGLLRATTPFFSWRVYPSGLGISILGIGKVFVPKQQIKRLSKQKGLSFFTARYKLLHNSPELYNPVYFGDSKLFEALRVLLPQEIIA